MTIIEQINNENIKKEVPSFNVGDTVKVSVKVVEEDHPKSCNILTYNIYYCN